jgi:TonB-dependent SusC/RagA subfamily outer membrane receptor
VISELAREVPLKKTPLPEQSPKVLLDIRVKGKVTAKDDGTALAGVNIIVKGTQIGTTTDAEGAYAIQLPGPESVLVYSFLGFTTQEMPAQGQSTMDIQLLADTRQLSEVVVTAAGIERRSGTLGYSVSTLKAQDLAQKNEPDPMRALTGKMAGVNIQGGGGVAGGATNVTIRGNSSLGNNNQPLYVVDGVPFDNSTYAPSGDRQTQSNQSTASRAFDIDPNNIQSLTVLKGAAAAAMYGSRAANGAIINTTKPSAKEKRALRSPTVLRIRWKKSPGCPIISTPMGKVPTLIIVLRFTARMVRHTAAGPRSRTRLPGRDTTRQIFLLFIWPTA